MDGSELLYKVADSVGIPVDISKVEASDSIQSHLSTMNSSKRLRNTPINKSLSDRLRMPDAMNQSARGFVQAIFLPNHLTLPIAHTPTRPTRLERPSCFKFKYGVLLYCFLSCVITSVRLYINLYGKEILHDTTRTVRISGPPSYNDSGNASFVHYLTRMLATSSGSVTLEPYILSNMHPNSSVTLCAWASDSEFESLDENWPHHWHGSVSLLITTTAAPSSIAHRILLNKIRNFRSHVGLSIHILHVPSGQPKSPNMYLNLARLFAMTSWALLFPSSISAQLHPQLYANIASRQPSNKQVHLLSVEASGYPFQPLSPLLLARDRDFWCTERFFLENSRISDWDECLWQLSLDTFGEIEILDTKSSEYPIEEWTRQPLSSRYHAELCDALIKQLMTSYQRSGYKETKLDYLRKFCSSKKPRL